MPWQLWFLKQSFFHPARSLKGRRNKKDKSSKHSGMGTLDEDHDEEDPEGAHRGRPEADQPPE